MFAMTRSGSRLRIFSRSGFFSPPMRVLPRTTARGSTQYTVIPASASASPSAQSVSVMLGTSETIRRGGLASSTATPDASTLASIRRPRAVGLRVQIERRRLFPQGLALGLEVPGVHEVQAVMQVHLELAAAVSAADPARGILEERLHLARGQPNEPLEADRSRPRLDRKSTRLNSSHSQISYAVFCLKKKKKKKKHSFIKKKITNKTTER